MWTLWAISFQAFPGTGVEMKFMMCGLMYVCSPLEKLPQSIHEQHDSLLPRTYVCLTCDRDLGLWETSRFILVLDLMDFLIESVFIMWEKPKAIILDPSTHYIITFWRFDPSILAILGGLNKAYYSLLFMQLFPQLIGADHLNGLSTALRIKSLMRSL